MSAGQFDYSDPSILPGIIQGLSFGKSLVSRIHRGELRLFYGSLGLVAHDRDGVVVHEFPTQEEVAELAKKIGPPEGLKSERVPSGEFPFPESKIRGAA